jgi:hypothetical protein
VSISKNFVIKHGLEASADLILANADTRKVGIGTTAPEYTLHVNGGIGATDFYLTGIGTFVDELNVGLGGTVLTVLGIGNSIGIGTALPAYLLDIRSPVSTGQTALYVQGDVRITGDLSLDDVTLDDATIQNLTVTEALNVTSPGISTFGGYVDINDSVDISSNLNVVGLSTLGSYVDINDSVDISNDLNVVGLSTLGGYVDINNSVDVGVNLNVVGLSTLGGYVDINDSVDISIDLNVSGITTLATVDINAGDIEVSNVDTTDLNVTGIATIATISVVGAALSNLTVSGSSTLDNLNVTGISTLGTVVISSGIITATSGIVTYFGDGSNLTGLAGNPTLQTVLNVSNTSTIGMSISGVSTFAILDIDSASTSSIIGTSGTITNFTCDSITASGIITASAFIGNGFGLTGVGIGSTGSISTSGIITASAFIGNGSGLTGVGIGSTGSIDTVGIITASAFFGDGSGLTGAGSTVFNDTTTNQEFFPLFTNTTTGTITASGISTSKLTYNPSSGEVTAVDFNSTSDFNLKTNIQTVDNALEIVDNLRGVSFEWKENGKKSYGVIAQELEKVLPELVKGGDPKTVSYSGIIGVLIESIKELKKEVEKLKEYK